MRLRLTGLRRAHDDAPAFSVDTSPYADRLRLARPFADDEETAATREERKTYDTVIWFGPFCDHRPLDH